MMENEDEYIVTRLRDHVAAVHRRDCPRSIADQCTCNLDTQVQDLLREAAARIEVAVEALEGDRLEKVRAAIYALTKSRSAAHG